MAENPDDPLILLEILEVLGACHGSVSYADICVYLSGRFSLQTLLDLRSLLYSTACKDTCFPSTHFREHLHPPCSNQLSAAADVVSLFNLLMHTRVAPTYAQNVQTLTPCQVCGKGFLRYEWPAALPIAGGGTTSEECKYENLPCQVISLNTGASNAQAHPHSSMHNQESMQNTHSVDPFSEKVNPEAAKKPKANQEARIVRSCSQKRSAFKDGFRNLVPLISMEVNGQSEQSPDGPREDGEDLLSITQNNPYPDTPTYTDDDHTCSLASHMECLHDDSHIYATLEPMTVTHEVNVHYVDAPNPYSPGQTQWHQTKHESLDELQTSTYFGAPVDHHKLQTPALQVKSHSLDIDSRTADERPEPENAVLQKPRSERSVLERSGLRKPGSVKLSFDGSSFDIPGFDPRIVSSMRDTFKRLSSISLDAWCDWSPSADGVASVGTQTEQADRRALRSLMLSEKLSIDNPDIAEDDISAIFRFLDDISMCGSMAVLPGEGGGAQEGGGAGLPERRERLGKLRKLFHSLEAPEEGVRWGVGRLLQRVTEMEQRLEPITELREQLALVLSTLDRLEQREQIACPHLHQMHIEQQPPARPNIQQQGSPRINPGVEGAIEAAAKRRRLFVRRASRSHTESGSSEAHREWSISFSKEPHIQPVKSDQLGGVYKRDYPIPQEVMGFHLMPTEDQKAQRRTSVQSTSQNVVDRPKVTWSQSDLTPLELQAPESLEFWTDEIYTPASDTLLRRSQSYPRCNRNQAYRIAALSITATIILILIIVIPVSTM